MNVRVCTECKIEKPLTNEYFHKNRTRLMGLDYRCKECSSLRKDPRSNRWVKYTEERKVQYTTTNRNYGRTQPGRVTTALKAYQNFDNKRGYDFDLTREYLLSIVGSPCTYCGYPATGVDRLNNRLGHTLANCVPCCKECNVARMDNFTYAEMLVIGKAIKEVKDSRLINNN